MTLGRWALGLRACLFLGVYAGNLFPPLALLTSVFPPLFPVAMLMALPLAWFLLEKRGWKYRIPSRLHSAYAALCIGALAALFGRYEWTFGGSLFLLHSAAVAGACLAFARRERPRWVGAYLVLFLLWAGYLALLTRSLIPYGAFLVIASSCVLNWTVFARTMAGFTWKSVAPAVAVTGTLGFAAILKLNYRSEWHPLVLDQPGVESLADFRSSPWRERGKHDVRFVSDSCDGRSLMIGLSDESGRRDGLAKLDLVERGLEFSSDVRQVSDPGFWSCPENLFYVWSIQTSTLLAFPGGGPLAPARSRVFPGVRGGFMEPARSGLWLGLVADPGPRMWAMDLRSWRSLVVPGGGRSTCMFWDSEDRLGVVESVDPYRAKVFRLAERALLVEERRTPSPSRYGPLRTSLRNVVAGTLLRAQGWCKFDPSSSTLWLPDMESGELRGIDAYTGVVKNTLKLETGIRYLTMNDSFSRMAVSNYLTGEVYVMRVEGAYLTLLRRLFVGPLVRFPDFSRDGRWLYVGSTSGIFRVDLNAPMVGPLAPGP